MITLTLEQFYHLILIPPAIIALVDASRHAPDYHFSRLRGAFYAALMVALGYWGVYLGADFYNLFRVARGQDASQRLAIFGSIVVFFIGSFLVIMLEKGIRALLRRFHLNVPDVSLRDTWDMLEPGAFIFIMFTKFRCLWAGCCFGIPCSWGIYNETLNGRAFPVQIVEACMSFCIVIFVYCLTQTKFFRRGMALFLAALMFSFGRFFLEYLMYYPPEDRTYLGIFTFWQCGCILVALVCVAVLMLLYKTQPAEPIPKKRKGDAETEEQEVSHLDSEPITTAVPKTKKKLVKKITESGPKKAQKKQTVTQKKYSKGWQSTKKKYKKKK